MNLRRVVSVGVAILGLALLAGGVYVVREATLTRHEPADASSELVVELEASGSQEARHDVLTMVDGLVRVCQTGVDGVLSSSGIERVSSERFRFTVRPALDPADRDKFKGCLNDMTVDRLSASVQSMQERVQ